MNTHTKIDGNSEIDRLKLVMKTGTLPSLRELNKHFLPDHITRLRPLALELEVARSVHTPVRDSLIFLPPN